MLLVWIETTLLNARADSRGFTSPIILILLAATGLAFFLADPTDTAIILMIVAASVPASVGLGTWKQV